MPERCCAEGDWARSWLKYTPTHEHIYDHWHRQWHALIQTYTCIPAQTYVACPAPPPPQKNTHTHSLNNLSQKSGEWTVCGRGSELGCGREAFLSIYSSARTGRPLKLHWRDGPGSSHGSYCLCVARPSHITTALSPGHTATVTGANLALPGDCCPTPVAELWPTVSHTYTHSHCHTCHTHSVICPRHM